MPIIPLADRFEVRVDVSPPPTALGRMHPLDATDPGMLMWLLPTLGPTATLIYTTLIQADGMYIILDELGWQHGVPASRAHKAIDRLARFRCADIIEGGAVVVPHRFPPQLVPAKLEEAPAWWAAAHADLFPTTTRSA